MSTGSRNGLRRPAGARKNRGSLPTVREMPSCASAISARIPAGPSSEKSWRCRWLWFSIEWPRRTISRARSACRSTRSPTQKNDAGARAASSCARTWGVTAGSGPSSMVMATSPRPPLAAGSRTQFGPRSRLLGQRPAAVSTAMIGRDGPERPGPRPRVHHGRARGARVNGGGGRQGRRCQPSQAPRLKLLHVNLESKKFSHSRVHVSQSWPPDATSTASAGSHRAINPCAGANRSSRPYPRYNGGAPPGRS